MISAAVLVVVILFLGGIFAGFAGLVRTIVFSKNCAGTVLVQGDTASCLPKIDLSKPPGIVEDLALALTMREISRLIHENDPTIIHQRNGLWDACPLAEMPSCEEKN